MNRPPEGAASERAGQSAAARFWAGSLDPRNLKQGKAERSGISLEAEMAFAATPDFLAAREWLLPHPPGDGRRIRLLDIGAGLGTNSFLFARGGAFVICVDTSIERLRCLRARAAEAGCLGSIVTVCAAAEELPLASGSLRAIYSKSVLIHTDLPRAARELARTLAPSGRAALCEPQPGNPFAWLYRRTFAPKEWRRITKYFGEPERAAVLLAMGAQRSGVTRPFYLFSFLAFAFHFALPNHRLFLAALKGFGAADRFLFRRFPVLRRFAWFGLILV